MWKQSFQREMHRVRMKILWKQKLRKNSGLARGSGVTTRKGSKAIAGSISNSSCMVHDDSGYWGGTPCVGHLVGVLRWSSMHSSLMWCCQCSISTREIKDLDMPLHLQSMIPQNCETELVVVVGAPLQGESDILSGSQRWKRVPPAFSSPSALT